MNRRMLFLYGLLAECAVFGLTRRCESFGLPAVEAQAFGTPAVHSRCGAVPEICGWGASSRWKGTWPPRADVLMGVLTDGALWREKSGAARENAARFTWEKSSSLSLEVLFAAAGMRP